MHLRSINPSTGELVCEYAEISFEDTNAALENSHKVFLKWRNVPAAERCGYLSSLAALLRAEVEALAFLITTEMGKPVAQSRAEIEKCALLCDYYRVHAETFLRSHTVNVNAGQAFVALLPMGPLLGIMPWNFPFWQVFRFAVPAIAAGNTVLLKHASNVPGCSLAIERLFAKAGFPTYVFKSLLMSNSRVETVINDKRIRAISLTGSTHAGKEVGMLAGKHLKKTVMELGGSDPYVILEDADLNLAVEKCVEGRLINTGQSCIAAKRFIVVDEVYSLFEQMFTERMCAAKMGDPFDASVRLGPLARMNLREDLHKQVMKSIDQGAKVLCGAQFPNGPGYYYPATVLSEVKEGMPAWNEELFGPVASLIRVKNEREAIEVANCTSFGLGAAVFTTDLERGRRIAEHELEAGCCFVNDFVKSDPRLPFGGIKESGYGRELSYFGIAEFLNVKTVWVK